LIRQVAGARIVALTGWGQAGDRQRTADAGFDHHLTKPADPAEIQRILEEVAVRVDG
jgi:CheY-like chemotaxis protein